MSGSSTHLLRNPRSIYLWSLRDVSNYHSLPDKNVLTNGSRHCLRRSAFRAFTSASSSVSIGSRRFSYLVDRAPAVSTYKPYTSRNQRRWVADEAAATQSEPTADGEEAAQHKSADNSIAQASEPTLEEQPSIETPPQSETEAVRSAVDAPTTTESVEVPPQAQAEDSILEKASKGFQAAAEAVGVKEAEPVEIEPSKANIYVGNLFFDVRSEDLKKEFSRAGEVRDAKVVQDARGLSKGYVFSFIPSHLFFPVLYIPNLWFH